MRQITYIECAVLAAIEFLEPDAYGMTIHRHCEEAGLPISYGTLYNTLDALEAELMISSRHRYPTPERGGRPKRLCSLEIPGKRALEAYLAAAVDEAQQKLKRSTDRLREAIDGVVAGGQLWLEARSRASLRVKGHYVLIGQTPTPEEDLLTWADWYETFDRQVKRTLLPWCEVSTIFLGLDHNHSFLNGQPILFETMVFWPHNDCYECRRCSTWSEAEAMHAFMVADVTRPGPFFAWLKRAWSDTISAAKDDWRSAWQALQGIEPDEFELSLLRMKEFVDARPERRF